MEFRNQIRQKYRKFMQQSQAGLWFLTSTEEPSYEDREENLSSLEVRQALAGSLP